MMSNNKSLSKIQVMKELFLLLESETLETKKIEIISKIIKQID